MIFELARVRKFSDDQERQECFCFKSIGLIVALGNLKFLKLPIFPCSLRNCRDFARFCFGGEVDWRLNSRVSSWCLDKKWRLRRQKIARSRIPPATGKYLFTADQLSANRSSSEAQSNIMRLPFYLVLHHN